jgi:orotate phosphoribosyltransferase-like protein
MNTKAECRQAKERIAEMQNAGFTIEQIVRELNIEFDGFFFIGGNGSIYRENVPDYAPATKLV